MISWGKATIYFGLNEWNLMIIKRPKRQGGDQDIAKTYAKYYWILPYLLREEKYSSKVIVQTTMIRCNGTYSTGDMTKIEKLH